MALDIKEDDKNLTVSVDVPGIPKQDIKASISNDVLTVSAERKQSKEGGDERVHWSERSYGHISRSVRLPKHVDQTKIQASYENGVLRLVIPKLEAEQPSTQQIKIA